MKNQRLNRLWFLLTIGAVIGIDQLTKWLAVRYLAPIGDKPLWEGVLHLTFHENPGIGFGMFKDQLLPVIILPCIALIAGLIFLFAVKKLPFWPGFFASMVVGGGIGNMIDRFFRGDAFARGEVVDFINFALIDFPVFNGADSFICVGAALLFLYVCVSEYKEQKAAKAAKKAAAETVAADEVTAATDDAAEDGQSHDE